MQSHFGTIVRGPGEGEALSVPPTELSVKGVEMSIKAADEDTDGSFTAIEYTAPPGYGGLPSHIHRETIESFYVLEGELKVTLAGNTRIAEAGGFVFVPTDVLHKFANASNDHPVRFLLVVSPGGLEGYFRELPGIIERHGYPPPPEVMEELGRRYDIETPSAES